MDDVGATPSRGKNAKSLLNLRQRTLPTAKNKRGKTPNVAPQYQSASESDSDNDDVGAQPPIGDNGKMTNPKVNLILTMMMLWLNLPEVKMERVC